MDDLLSLFGLWLVYGQGGVGIILFIKAKAQDHINVLLSLLGVDVSSLHKRKKVKGSSTLFSFCLHVRAGLTRV